MLGESPDPFVPLVILVGDQPTPSSCLTNAAIPFVQVDGVDDVIAESLGRRGVVLLGSNIRKSADPLFWAWGVVVEYVELDESVDSVELLASLNQALSRLFAQFAQSQDSLDVVSLMSSLVIHDVSNLLFVMRSLQGTLSGGQEESDGKDLGLLEWLESLRSWSSQIKASLSLSELLTQTMNMFDKYFEAPLKLNYQSEMKSSETSGSDLTQVSVCEFLRFVFRVIEAILSQPGSDSEVNVRLRIASSSEYGLTFEGPPSAHPGSWALLASSAPADLGGIQGSRRELWRSDDGFLRIVFVIPRESRARIAKRHSAKHILLGDQREQLRGLTRFGHADISERIRSANSPQGILRMIESSKDDRVQVILVEEFLKKHCETESRIEEFLRALLVSSPRVSILVVGREEMSPSSVFAETVGGRITRLIKPFRLKEFESHVFEAFGEEDGEAGG